MTQPPKPPPSANKNATTETDERSLFDMQGDGFPPMKKSTPQRWKTLLPTAEIPSRSRVGSLLTGFVIVGVLLLWGFQIVSKRGPRIAVSSQLESIVAKRPGLARPGSPNDVNSSPFPTVGLPMGRLRELPNPEQGSATVPAEEREISGRRLDPEETEEEPTEEEEPPPPPARPPYTETEDGVIEPGPDNWSAIPKRKSPDAPTGKELIPLDED